MKNLLKKYGPGALSALLMMITYASPALQATIATHPVWVTVLAGVSNVIHQLMPSPIQK